MINFRNNAFNSYGIKKQDRIARKTTIQNVINGGLGVPSLKHLIMAMKLTWVKKLNFSNHKWKSVIGEICPFVKELDKYGYDIPINKKCTNAFWRDTFQAYKTFGKKVHIDDPSDLLAENFFYNENVKLGGKMICFKEWIEKGVCQIVDLVNQTGSFLSYEEFKNKYAIKTHFIEYSGCVQSIKKFIRTTNIRINNNKSKNFKKALNIILSIKKGTRPYYDILTADSSQPKCCVKWNNGMITNLNWKRIFLKIQKIGRAHV